jgi:aspartate aminotransferase-like enzyme
MKKSLLFLPGPVPVAEPVLAAMSRPMINHRGPEFGAQLERVSRRLQGIFGTDGPVVLLGSSGTGGLEAAVANMFSLGDTLLACPVGVFGKRLAAIAQTYGCNVEILDTPLGSALDPQMLAARLRTDIQEHTDPQKRFRGVLLTHNETSTGVQNDMSVLAPILHEHGALTVVDSVSGLAASEFRMDEWGYDVVVSASQKALAAPPGIAMVALGQRAIAQLERATIPRFYFDLKKALEFAGKGQTPWTPPISIVYALDAALDIYERDGGPAIWARHDLYARAIRAAFEALGFTIFSQPNAHSVTVVAARPPEGVDAASLLKVLREQRGVVLSGGQGDLTGKIVRMGTMGDVTQTDVLGAIGAIEIALLDANAPVQIGSGVQAALRVFLHREALTPA